MEHLFGIVGSGGETETVCVERNYTYVEQSVISRSYVLTLIFSNHAHLQNCWLLHLVTEARIQSFIDECILKKKNPNR